MKVLDKLSLALRMFRTRPMRTSLTVLGVGVGIGTVIFLVSLGYGLQRTILDRIASADTLLTLDVSAGSDAFALSESGMLAIRKIPNIAEMSRMAIVPAQASFEGLTGDTRIMLIDPSLFRLSGISSQSGKLFTSSGDSIVVLSTATVMLFGKTPEEMVGKSIDLAFAIPQYASVSAGSGGILVQPQAASLSGSYVVGGVVNDDSTSYLYFPISVIQPSLIQRYDMLKVKVSDSNKLATVRQMILDQGYVVSAVSDIIDQASKIFHVLQIILACFGLVALIVSAIGMFNTMTITLLERTNEIGIMRAIGITRKDVRSIFLVESMLMGFLGGLGGLVLGEIAELIVNQLLNMLAQRFGGPPVSLFYTPLWFITVVLVFSSVIGFLTGLYPSFRASRLNPLDALRYK